MARNRALGSPYQVEVVTEDFTTTFGVDAYMVDAVPLVVTLDPYAVNGDQVVIQDITDSAAANPIVINASEDQTILNGYGSSIAISTNGGSVLLTMTEDGWVPQSGGGSTSTIKTFAIAGAGKTYDVKSTDSIVQLWTSAPLGACVAVLPENPSPGEVHTFIWTEWDGSQVPPIINGNGNLLTPWGGQTSPLLNGGLVAQTAITQTGGFMKLEFNGGDWFQTG